MQFKVPLKPSPVSNRITAEAKVSEIAFSPVNVQSKTVLGGVSPSTRSLAGSGRDIEVTWRKGRAAKRGKAWGAEARFAVDGRDGMRRTLQRTGGCGC
jgi:hypothetical protein